MTFKTQKNFSNKIKNLNQIVKRKKTKKKSKRQTKKNNTRSNFKKVSKKNYKKNDFTKGEIIKMEYPYRHLEITKHKMLSDFEKLKNYKTKILRYNPNPRKYKITPFKNNKPLIFIENYKENYDLYRITDYFSHKCRVRCIMNFVEDYSILELFNKNKLKMLEEFEKKNIPLTVYEMNEYLFRNFKDCTDFNTTMVMNILNLFKPKRWLDPSSGWSSRLIGAIAYGCTYTGIDPNRCLKNVYKEVINTLVKSAEDRKKYEVICDGFENVKVKSNYYDLVFTSPPFYDFEVYENNNSQSIEKFDTVDKWKTHFLFPLLKKSYNALVVGGYLALYITDYKGASYIKEMKNYVKHNIYGLRYEGDINWWNFDTNKKMRNIYVWKKIE